MVEHSSDKIDSILVFRSPNEQDHGFIISTWVNGLYYGSPWHRQIDQQTFFDWYPNTIKKILEKVKCEIQVVSLKEDPDVLVAYIVTTGNTLDWVYVKPAWRKLGIAKRLIPAHIRTVSHLNKVGQSLKPKDWNFIPNIF